MSPIERIKWAESISEKTCNALRELGWVDPNEAHESKGILKICAATMKVNFGPEGRCRPNLIAGDETLKQMVVKVFTFYEEQLKSRNERSVKLEAALRLALAVYSDRPWGKITRDDIDKWVRRAEEAAAEPPRCNG